jgi:hypothetical protein
MQATISTELLTRLVRATTEQLSAIELILGGQWAGGGGGAAGDVNGQGGHDAMERLTRIEHKVDGLLAAARLPENKQPLPEAECLQVFRLFGELLGMGTDLVAAPARVFDLMVFKKMTKAETALECKCAASLITKRVGLIERHFAIPIERLRAFASDLKERQRTVKGDRYAGKKCAGPRDELDQWDDGGRPGAKEDDDGYLPEERQGYD